MAETIDINVRGLDQIERLNTELGEVRTGLGEVREGLGGSGSNSGLVGGLLKSYAAITASSLALKGFSRIGLSATSMLLRLDNALDYVSFSNQTLNRALVGFQSLLQRQIIPSVGLGAYGMRRWADAHIGTAQAIINLRGALIQLPNAIQAVQRDGVAVVRWLRNLGSSINNAVGGITGFIAKTLAIKGAIAVATFAIAGLSAAGAAIVGVFIAMTRRVEEFTRQARRLGVTVEELQEIKFAAEQAGSSIQTLSLALRSADTEKLEALGITGTGAERVYQLADAFARLGTAQERTALATELFGRHGIDLVPLLERGRVGIDELRESFRATGNVISDDAAESFRELNDIFNETKNRVLGVVTELAVSALPLVIQGFENAQVAITGFRSAIQPVITTINLTVETMRGFELVSRGVAEEVYVLGNRLGFTSDQVDRIKGGFDRGFLGTLQDYFTTWGSITEIQDRNHMSAEQLTIAYLEQWEALRQLENVQLEAEQGIIGVTSAQEIANQKALAAVARYNAIRQANAEAEVITRMFTGAIFDQAGAANTAVAANNALAQSIDGVTNATNRYTLARGDILQARVGLSQVRAHQQSVALSQTPPVTTSASSGGSTGIGGTLEEAVARAMGRVVTSDFPIAMQEAIEAATIDWNMAQTNEGQLELLRMGDSHLTQVIDAARQAYEQANAHQQWWDNAVARQEASRERRAAEAARQREQLIQSIRQQQAQTTRGIASQGGGVADALFRQAAQFGYTGSNLLAAQAVVQRAQQLGGGNIRIQVIQDESGQWIARQVNEGQLVGAID